MKNHFDKFAESMRETNQRSESLKQDAQQSRLAMEVDVTADIETRKRTAGAAAAERVIRGDNSSAQVDTDPIRLTSFGEDSIGPPAPPCSRDDALVSKGAVAPKPCFSPVKMRTPTAAGGLLPAGKASTATRIIFYHLPLRLWPTEETNFWTPNHNAMD